MEETREISALFHLIDDPDNEVYTTVSDRIVSFGKHIIPNLENLWENTPDEEVQERIEMLIHRLHLRDLTAELVQWKKQPEPDLLTGALLMEMLLLEILESMHKLGVALPILKSANSDEGPAYNSRLLRQYRERLRQPI